MEAQRHRARNPSLEPALNTEFPTQTTDHSRPFARTAAALPAPPPGPPGLFSELPRGATVGEYAIESKIGEGAMGTVYRAVHPTIGRHVAIKVMTPKLFDEPESVARFISEARAVAAIRHPGIVDVFGFGRLPDNRTYLVMEWLEGSALSARIAHGKISLEDACDMIRQIARALEAAHAKGIVHRDLKPENVFVHHIDDEKPQCKLLDFGLAKVTNKEDNAVARTRTGQLLGTPLYMSPEQCKAKGVDHRTDIYALGCIAYELLCGRVPFDADNVAELISAHLVAQPPQPLSLNPALPPALDRLLLQMVSKNPDERPSLAEVRRVISGALSRPSQPHLAVRADDITPPPPTGPGAIPSGFSTGSSPQIAVPPQDSGSTPVPLPVALPTPSSAASLAGNTTGPIVREQTPVPEMPPMVPWPTIIAVIAIIAGALALVVALR
jgi:serine/threonine protein kinase